MRFTSKDQLITSIETEHCRFVELLESIPQDRFLDPGVWGDDWNIRDLLAHLAEWHRMLLGWYRTGLDGGRPEMPASGYKWNQTPVLNRHIQERFREQSVEEAWADFETSYEEVFSLARELSEELLLESGHFAWTGKNHLTTYLGANTTSHYRTASKILQRWLRAGGAKTTGESGDST